MIKGRRRETGSFRTEYKWLHTIRVAVCNSESKTLELSPQLYSRRAGELILSSLRKQFWLCSNCSSFFTCVVMLSNKLLFPIKQNKTRKQINNTPKTMNAEKKWYLINGSEWRHSKHAEETVGVWVFLYYFTMTKWYFASLAPKLSYTYMFWRMKNVAKVQFPKP